MSFDRDSISRSLYIEGDARDASHRHEVNAQLGTLSLINEIRSALALKPGASVLDVGCGTGEHLEALAREVGQAGRCAGIDFSPQAVTLARERIADVHIADAASAPFENGSFDAICCNYVIYYLSDSLTALREWRRLLVAGGKLVITGPAVGNNAELYAWHLAVTGSPPSDADTMANGYVKDCVFPLIGEAGFRAVDLKELTNRLQFPSREEFTSYWTATSLFLRTIPVEQRQAAVAAASAQEIDCFRITKKVTMLVAEAC